MAQVDCANRPVVDEDMKKPSLDSAPPFKKLKQARLPFQPLEQKQQLVPNGPQLGNKKRKSSVEMESPTVKAARRLVADKPSLPDNEPEVSSSSEADNLHGMEKASKNNTLDRFLKKSSPEEISSTNMECIDLTDENIDPDLTSEEDPKVHIVDIHNESSKQDLSENDCDNLQSDPPVAVSSPDTEGGEIASQQTLQLNALTSVLLSPLQSKVSQAKARELGLVPEECPVQSDADKSIETSSENGDLSQDDTAEISQNDTAEISQNDEDSELQESAADNDSDAADSSDPVNKLSPDTNLPQTPDLNGRPLLVSTPKSDGASSLKTPKRKLNTSTSKSSSKKVEKEAQRQKINEQREKEREERKLKQEKEKQEKEHERLEKKKQRDEEKAEKERQKKEEKDKKEKERLDKLQQKEDEKKKKQELIDAKIEEKKKKDEERKLKEEEKQKEDEEKARKKDKRKEAFQSFFIKQKSSPPAKTKEVSGLFMPFEPKKNMKLAPERRHDEMTGEIKSEFDGVVQLQTCDNHYLKQLKDGKITPGRSGKTWPRVVGLDEDVEIMMHDSEVLTYRVKFLYFNHDTRPPYYGTWRKTSKCISPRNYLKQDNDLLDYDVDSDAEWEEEEPGESLSASEGEEEDDGDKADEEEDGWMVPHGYLSEDEVDDEESLEKLKLKQELMAKAWEKELQQKKKFALQLVIGCVWEGPDNKIEEQFEKSLGPFKAVFLSEGPVLTSFNNLKKIKAETDTAEEKNKSGVEKRGQQKRPVPEEALPYLIRLVHGSTDGIQRLIKKFRIYWRRKTRGETNVENALDMSMEVEDDHEEVGGKTTKSEEDKPLDESITHKEQGGQVAEEFSISKRQLEKKIASIAVREKRATMPKICWYVHNEVLKQYDLQDIKLPVRICVEPVKIKTPKSDETPNKTGRKTPGILQFAQPMSPSQIASQAPILPPKDTSEKTEGSGAETLKSPVPVKLLPSDQRSIMDFAKKIAPSVLKPTASRLLEQKIAPSVLKPTASRLPEQAKSSENADKDKMEPMETDSATTNQCVSVISEENIKDKVINSPSISLKTANIKELVPAAADSSVNSVSSGIQESADQQMSSTQTNELSNDVIVID